MPRVKKDSSGPKFMTHTVDAAEMYTIGPSDEVWQDASKMSEGASGLKGAYVRLKPPPGTSDEQVSRVMKILLDEIRVAAVKLLPVPDATVIAAETDEEDPMPAFEVDQSLSHREMVSEVIAEMGDRTRDADALEAFCDECMSKVGI